MDPALLDKLLAITSLFQRDMARAFAGTALTEARVTLLWTLAHRGPSTQQALAGALSVTPRNVSALVDALESAGYVRRAPHPTDRRAVLVELTAVGDELMVRMREEHAQLNAALLGAVDPGDRQGLERGVGAILERLAQLVSAADSEQRAAPRGEA